MKVLITVGPIPAKLDSVKFLSNRFKGGLALKTAEMLKQRGHDVYIVAWKHAELKTNIPITRIEDVVDYVQTVLSMKMDAYILSAAVANLMPSNPYEGKFPSHKYKVGEKFNVEFEIAPRLIDMIKVKYPTATLIGYKLYDGTNEDLVKAGVKTLTDSKANLVFANNPIWAKDKKIAITSDGACFEINFDEHVEMMDKLIKDSFYKTILTNHKYDLSNEDCELISNYPKYEKDGSIFGCFAIKKTEGFITTTRGKKKGVEKTAFVSKVDHENLIVYANEKATLNAPLLDMFFSENPDFNYILHGHDLEGIQVDKEYSFAGTKRDNKYAIKTEEGQKVMLNHHGYIVGFKTFEKLKEFLNAKRLE